VSISEPATVVLSAEGKPVAEQQTRCAPAGIVATSSMANTLLMMPAAVFVPQFPPLAANSPAANPPHKNNQRPLRAARKQSRQAANRARQNGGSRSSASAGAVHVAASGRAGAALLPPGGHPCAAMGFLPRLVRRTEARGHGCVLQGPAVVTGWNVLAQLCRSWWGWSCDGTAKSQCAYRLAREASTAGGRESRNLSGSSGVDSSDSSGSIGSCCSDIDCGDGSLVVR